MLSLPHHTRIFWLIVFVIISTMISYSVHAESVDRDKAEMIDWNSIEWKFLDPLRAFTTSKCIGNPKTPLCAIETYFACHYWKAKSLCDAVKTPFDRYKFRASSNEPLFRYSIYPYGAIMGLALEKSDIPKQHYESNGPKLKERDVAIRIVKHTCIPNPTCLTKNSSIPNGGRKCRSLHICAFLWYEDEVHVVRRAETGWRYLGLYFRPDFPRLYPSTNIPPRISSFATK